MAQRLGEDLADGHARVERGVGVLEDDLHVRGAAGAARCVEAGDRRSPSKRTAPAVGSIRRRTSRPIVDLPQPDSPTRPASRRGAMSKVTPSTARTVPTALRQTTPRVTGKCLTRPLDLEHGRVAHARAPCASSTGAFQQATRWPGADARAAAAARLAAARGRRTGSAARSGSPCGWSTGLGTVPSIVDSRSRVAVERAGSSPAGRACRDAAGRRTARATGALSTIGRRTSRPRRRPSRRPRRGRG